LARNLKWHRRSVSTLMVAHGDYRRWWFGRPSMRHSMRDPEDSDDMVF